MILMKRYHQRNDAERSSEFGLDYRARLSEDCVFHPPQGKKKVSLYWNQLSRAFSRLATELLKATLQNF